MEGVKQQVIKSADKRLRAIMVDVQKRERERDEEEEQRVENQRIIN